MAELTDEQYRQAVNWCQQVVTADGSADAMAAATIWYRANPK